MRRAIAAALMPAAGALLLSACAPRESVLEGFGGSSLCVVNRVAVQIDERNGLRLTSASGNGVAWLQGSEFRTGTLEVDVRGQESRGQLYVGVAFHRQSDAAYEAVYVRPFNFRNPDTQRRQHAVQYIA